jgi:hypothetical protein
MTLKLNLCANFSSCIEIYRQKLQGCEAFYDFRNTSLACEVGKVTLD